MSQKNEELIGRTILYGDVKYPVIGKIMKVSRSGDYVMVINVTPWVSVKEIMEVDP